MERVICNKCGATYLGWESLQQVKKWIEGGHTPVPCPNITCEGELKVVTN